MDPTISPDLNPIFSIIFLISISFVVIVELIGLKRKGDDDTITANWRWIEKWLPNWAAWFFRVFTGGLLVWVLLHFLVGSD